MKPSSNKQEERKKEKIKSNLELLFWTWYYVYTHWKIYTVPELKAMYYTVPYSIPWKFPLIMLTCYRQEYASNICTTKRVCIHICFRAMDTGNMGANLGKYTAVNGKGDFWKFFETKICHFRWKFALDFLFSFRKTTFFEKTTTKSGVYPVYFLPTHNILV